MLRPEMFKIGRNVAHASPRLKLDEIRQFDGGITAQRLRIDRYRIWVEGQLTMFDLINGRFIQVRGWEPVPAVRAKEPEKKKADKKKGYLTSAQEVPAAPTRRSVQ